MTAVLAAACVAASAAGVWISIRLAGRVGAIDVPNERSSHSSPTPRMGGVPMVGAAVIAFAGWVSLAGSAAVFLPRLAYVLLFAAGMSALGLWDDIAGLSPLLRFLVQLVGASVVLWVAFGKVQTVFAPGYAIPLGAWILAAAIWVVWMVNLYNFMDGIDGIAGGEAAVASVFFCAVFGFHGHWGWAAANLFVAASAAGFLVHNWPPARVFMGDSGSAFLGGFYGMQAVVAAVTTAVPFAVLVLPFANFILDTTVTLLGRIWRRERWYAAHRSHFYQRMVGLGMTHRDVTLLELLSAVGSCIAAALCLVVGPAARVLIVISVVAAFSGAAVWVARCERKHGETLPA